MSKSIEEQKQAICTTEHTPFYMTRSNRGSHPYYRCEGCGYIDVTETVEQERRKAAVVELKRLEGCPPILVESTLRDRIKELENDGGESQREKLK